MVTNMSDDIFSISKSFIEKSMDIILAVDKNGKILYGNKKAVETYGYTYKELLNLSIFDFRNEDIKKCAQNQLDEALQIGIEFKTYHYKKDGSRFPVEVRSIYSSVESKNMVVSIIRDITDTEKVTKDARMFSTSLDILEDAIIVLTKDFKVSHWSKGAEDKFGYKSEEIVGKNIDVLIPNNEIDEFNNKIDLVKSGNIVKSLETTRIHKNRNTMEVSISISPIYDIDGIFSGAVAVYKDISEKNMLIEKLKEYEKRWRFALEGGQFGVGDWNIKNNRTFYSTYWKTMLGYSEEEITDGYEEWESRVHPDDLPNVLDKINRHFKGEVFLSEYRMKCKNNTYKWIRTRGKVISFADNGDPLRMISTNEDITESILIEQQLMENNKQLELLKQEADNANKEKSLFLANMSHEIRTPMNGILGILQLLQSGGLNEEQSKYTKMLKESADNLLAIINNLLDISKIESGTFKLNSEPFNLKETINNIYNILLITGNSKGLEVSYYLDSNIDFEVIGDDLRLKEILLNLISNAIKFTDDGYVSFRVKSVSTGENIEKIEFRIKDSGIGIEDGFRDKIFHNFSQGELSTRKKYMGTGLGLAISKQLATLMKGDIWFESVVGQGATFFFTCEFKKQRNKGHKIKENNTMNQKFQISNLEYDKVILCVEDNLINQGVMESIIKRKGYKYMEAYNGKEALDLLKNNKVDLILMDVQMPELNGFDTTKIIRAGELDGEHIPIIALTAYAMIEDKDKCIKAGMDEYITKPFDIEKLYELINFYLEK